MPEFVTHEEMMVAVRRIAHEELMNFTRKEQMESFLLDHGGRPGDVMWKMLSSALVL
jgi:hypothetical protein